jgi:hypothetical protein
MQREEFKDRVYISKYESTSSTHVNIKMHSPKPKDFYYYVLVYEKKNINKNPYFAYTDDKWYAREKPKALKYTTLIVFSSSQTILTGRYPNNMKDNYDFFVKLCNKYKSEIMESVCRPKISIREYLELCEKNNAQELAVR